MRGSGTCSGTISSACGTSVGAGCTRNRSSSGFPHDERRPRLRHPGPSLVRRCARFGRYDGSETALRPRRPCSRRYVLLALPLHVDLASASVQGGLTVRASNRSVKYLGQVIWIGSTSPKIPLSIPFLGDGRKWALQPSEVSATLCLRMARRPVMTPKTTAPLTSGVPRTPRLGERLRSLRVALGLTQGQLAGDRFSKEYISQIERGKTKPTVETTEWLAARLGVDSSFLRSGVSADERARAETILARADALLDEHRFDEAVEGYARALPAVLGTGAVELQVRVLNGEGMALAQTGDVRTGLERLAEARALV